MRKCVCPLLFRSEEDFSFRSLPLCHSSDNIDFDTGDLDDVENIVRFDDTDLFGKAFSIANALKALQDSGDFNDETQCNALLSEFHRVDEFGDAFKWVGGIVTEVCLASGTTEVSVKA